MTVSKYSTYTLYEKNSNRWFKEKHKDLVFLVFLQKIHNSLGSVSGEQLSLIFSGFEKTSSKPAGFNFSTFNSKLHAAVSQRRQQQQQHHRHSPASPNGKENNVTSVQTSAFGEEHLKRTTLRWSSLHKLQLGPDGFKIPTPSQPWEWVMKAEAFTGAAQGVNADHYATENKAFITTAVFSPTVNLAQKKNAVALFSRNTFTEFRISFLNFKLRRVWMHYILRGFGASSVGFQMFKTN